jgi:type VI protein secretion system component VasK
MGLIGAYKKRLIIALGLVVLLLAIGYLLLGFVSSYFCNTIAGSLTGSDFETSVKKTEVLDKKHNDNLKTSDTLDDKILDYHAVVSEDSVRAIYDKMTNYDRLKIYYLLLKRLGKKILIYYLS